MEETQETQVWSLVGMIPWRWKYKPTSVFLSGESHGQRSLVGTAHGVAKSRTQLRQRVECYWACMHAHTHTHTHTHTQSWMLLSMHACTYTHTHTHTHKSSCRKHGLGYFIIDFSTSTQSYFQSFFHIFNHFFIFSLPGTYHTSLTLIHYFFFLSMSKWCHRTHLRCWVCIM